MKILTEKDVEKLDKRIKEEFGIDVQKYRNEKVVEKFVELLVFPEYVITWVIRPMLISGIIYLIGFKIFDLVHIEYLIYGIIGLFLFLGTGILVGLLLLTWRMKSDMLGIVNYTLEIMKTTVRDMNQINSQISKENRTEVFGLLFKGILWHHYVLGNETEKEINERK